MIDTELQIKQDDEERKKALAEAQAEEEPTPEKAVGILLDNVIEN